MENFGFYHPYEEDLDGVSPERWHLSYAPVSEKRLGLHSLELIRNVISGSEIEQKSVVLLELSTIFDRYFLNVSRKVEREG